MTPSLLLTPKMRGVIDRIHRAHRPPYHSLPPTEARLAYEAAAEILDLPRAPLPRVEDLTLPADDGTPLRARLYASSHGRLPVLLYLHGGGFTIGGIETHDSLCRQFALRSGAAVVSLEYRLAPEHRFPTAVEDAWAGLRRLHEQAAALGLDGTRLAVGGDSAGGTLAAVCAILARDAGLPLALQLLITPGTTAYQDTGSHTLFANGFILEQAAIDWFFDQYIEHRHRNDWRFAPLNADDVEGVAPAWVCLAECDPLVDEGIAYADRLRMAGVAVTLDLYKGVTHDFIKMGRAIPEALQAQAAGAQLLQEVLFP
ncbi:alpha/beta hydrolase [Schlegelella sp. S2-27]|uniref:Alpha/beta hydrolase n=1 Tax=Caldimonas mangrovi TaxID=2944811 RepID=A0ABT0YSG4_9BURK|nr:alpha/beta hydrolase [Caldimonas mangrovi]MCM5681227.1 alpha/beta hydrolase [Caldimonas mangrovi]